MALRLIRDAADHPVEMLRGDVQARAGAADLALIEEDGAGRAGDGRIEIRVRQDDDRRLAAQLHRHLLHVAGRRLHDQPADLGGSREGDLVDAGVGGERGARRRTHAGDDVEHALREIPPRARARPRRSAVSGVSSAGFNTTVQPAASAGAHFQVASRNGKFQAMMAPTTPIGSRVEKAAYCWPGTSVPDSGSVLPSILVGQPAM